MHIALYQPDIPQNLGSILRLCACMNVTCHIIEPCGFIIDDKRVERVAMDYIQHVRWQRHTSWNTFIAYVNTSSLRLVLLTTKTQKSYREFEFQPNDVLLLGRESAGVPQIVVDYVDASVTIPMHGEMRSLNIALAAAMVLGEAIRQVQLK